MSDTTRDSMSYDIVIVGAGPAGLSCAIRLKQLATEQGREISVCVLEKGSQVGAHLLSGAVLETRALDELIPDWKEKQAPLETQATSDAFYMLSESKATKMPTPPQMHNKGSYIISLSQFGTWLGQQAEMLGVEIYPGFAAAEILFHDDGCVKGVATGDMGVNQAGEKTDQYQPGIELHAQQTVFAEGCHGSLTKQLIDRFDLRADSDPQTYALGIKEVWEIAPEKHKKGHCEHTIGWPMDKQTYGGSWLYHYGNNLVSIGYVTGLDYTNPTLSPFEEMQRFKLHPHIKPLLDGGRRIAYGARALVEGGLQSLPKLTMPGAVLIGDTAGFLNVAKIKGNHTAMKSGMIAAESLYVHLGQDSPAQECKTYTQNVKKSWVYKELYKVRNIRPGFHKGLWFGLCHAAFQTIGGWLLPYTLRNHTDHTQLKSIDQVTPITYPKPDGVITFDRLSSVYLTNTNHEEDQPCHLQLNDPDTPVRDNLPTYGEPARLYCPAAVYEIVEDGQQASFIINAQNCIHCKTCDIKDPSQNINWSVPQGGGGPNYTDT